MNAAAHSPSNDRSQVDEAYADIRSAILRCVLAPGDRVAELQLAERFGFGRAAVRSALTRLATERLVEVIPRQGYAIAPVTFENVRDLYETRLAVEPAVARLAAERAGADVVPDLERLNLACVLEPGNPDLVAVREANKSFHAAVGRAADNQRLAALTATLMDELDRVLYLPQLAPLWDRLETTFAEHKRIVEAIRAHDPRAAEAAARKHVLANQQSATEALLASPQLRSINLLGP